MSGWTGGAEEPLEYGYAGAWTDPLTGLQRMGARRYDPEKGRFLEQDPAGESGGLNLYAYVGSAPTLWVDPTGLRAMVPGGIDPSKAPGASSALGRDLLAGVEANSREIAKDAAEVESKTSGFQVYVVEVEAKGDSNAGKKEQKAADEGAGSQSSSGQSGTTGTAMNGKKSGKGDPDGGSDPEPAGSTGESAQSSQQSTGTAQANPADTSQAESKQESSKGQGIQIPAECGNACIMVRRLDGKTGEILGDVGRDHGAGHVQIVWVDENGKVHNKGFFHTKGSWLWGTGEVLRDNAEDAAGSYKVIAGNLDPSKLATAVEAVTPRWDGGVYSLGTFDCQRFAASVLLEYQKMGGTVKGDLPPWFARDVNAVRSWSEPMSLGSTISAFQ